MAARALSAQQQRSFAGHVLPVIEEHSPGAFSIPMRMPDSSLGYSFCYALEGAGKELHLIDTGMAAPGNWEALLSQLRSIGHNISQVASVTLTHLHRDHTGMANRIRAASGATIRMHSEDARAARIRERYVESDRLQALLEQWQVPRERRNELRRAASRVVAGEDPPVIDDELEDARVVALGPRALRVVHTPGHTRGHVILADDSARIVYSGDHLLPMINPGIGLGGWDQVNQVCNYLASLELIRSLNDYGDCPGHGYRFDNIPERCETTKAHILRRAKEVHGQMQADRVRSTWAVASSVSWTAGWRNLHDSDLLSALMQTWWHAQTRE